MASLASYTTLHVTAIRVEGPVDVRNIVAVRWAGERGREESSVGDFISWLDHGSARAYVQQPDGSRGPRVHVDHDGIRRHLRSRPGEDGDQDALLSLPRWQSGRAKHMIPH